MAHEKATAVGNDKGQRRVYVLPNDLVERIGSYQQELGLGSEVEAVRRLLDEALKGRDTFRTITDRLVAHLKMIRSLRDAAKEILTDHPLVKSIAFEDNELRFLVEDGFFVEINSLGIATVKGEDNYIHDFGEDRPTWASSYHKKKSGGGRMSEIVDDDIPF